MSELSFGPVVVCEWRTESDALSAAPRARLTARQGVGSVIAQPFREVVFADELPRTATGKVQKFARREQFSSALTALGQPER